MIAVGAVSIFGDQRVSFAIFSGVDAGARCAILLMLNRSSRRLVVSIDEIRSHSREMADGLLDQPFDYSQAFDRALKNIVKTLGNRPAFETAEETVGLTQL